METPTIIRKESDNSILSFSSWKTTKTGIGTTCTTTSSTSTMTTTSTTTDGSIMMIPPSSPASESTSSSSSEDGISSSDDVEKVESRSSSFLSEEDSSCPICYETFSEGHSNNSGFHQDGTDKEEKGRTCHNLWGDGGNHVENERTDPSRLISLVFNDDGEYDNNNNSNSNSSSSSSNNNNNNIGESDADIDDSNNNNICRRIVTTLSSARGGHTTTNNNNNNYDDTTTNHTQQQQKKKKKTCRSPSERIILPTCGHVFCRSCLRSHCRYEISTRRVIPIGCPNTGCSSSISDQQVMGLLLVPTSTMDDDYDNYSTSMDIENQQHRSQYGSIEMSNHHHHRHHHHHGSLLVDNGRSNNNDDGITISGGGSYDDVVTVNTNNNNINNNDDVCTRTSVDVVVNNEWTNDWMMFQRLKQMSLDKSLVACVRCQEGLVSVNINNRRRHCHNDRRDNVHVFEMAVNDRQGNHRTIEDDDENDDKDDDDDRKNDINERKDGAFPKEKSSQDGHMALMVDQVTCPACGHTFCPIHGDAHPGVSCQAYERANRQKIHDERTMIEAMGCKPCSHCHAIIQKESGCDHIVCTVCHKDMCFKCGTHLYLEGESMVRTCRRCDQSFIDHRHIWTYRARLCLMLPFYLPFIVLHIAIVGVVALATLGCCCCLCCGIQPKSKRNGGPKIDGSPPAEEEKEEEEGEEKGGCILRPMMATQIVLAMTFLPVLDVANQFGVDCSIGRRHVFQFLDDTTTCVQPHSVRDEKNVHKIDIEGGGGQHNEL